MAEGSWIRIKATRVNLDATTVNSIIKTVLGRKAVSITQQPDVRKDIGEAYIEAVTPLVPKRSGDLRESGRATNDGRVYWSSVHRGYNYAYNVFDENYARWGPGETYVNPSTTGTHPRWTDKMKHGTREYKKFLEDATDIIIDAARKGLL
jgi:hypothetical protein